MPLSARILPAALAFALALSLTPTAPLFSAYAHAEETASTETAENPTALASSGDETASPCLPSESELQAYAEDGTLDQRLAYQESLGNEEYDAGLIESARSREAAATSGASAYSQTVPGNWESGMGSVGEAHVLALHVTFPDDEGEPAAQFPEGDDVEALQSLIGPVTEGFESTASGCTGNEGYYPYESLHEYYYRSSYGKLSVDGVALEYEALHPASHYDNGLEELYIEALAQLDDELDYSKFDGNGDGRIDALYVHFACENPQWGTAWWSNEQTCKSEGAAVLRDGVRLWNAVSLHNASNTEYGVRTAIHETGHVLGLPDLYSYLDQSSTRTGVLTFDMMNTNCGDHNGFSKWMLGWIDSDDITRIVANDDGVTVKDGNADPVSYSSDAVARAELSTYAGDDCGGIVAVSNSEELITGDGLFSSYYLVQYDDYVNNQSVSADTAQGRIELPAGFRVFRVQAELLPSGVDFAHNNTHGKVHNQLIEIVDPEGDAKHADYDGFIVAEGASAYGCMYHAGDAVAPTTSPSTNFYESLSLGFTGLSIDFLAETPATDDANASGTLEVSYSSEFKPDSSDFSIVRADDEAVFNIDQVSFEASSEVQFNSAGSGGGPVGSPRAQGDVPYPYLIVDGEVVSVKAEVSGKSINVTYTANASVFADAQDCLMVFPAESFIIGYDENGQAVLSPEISIKLDIAELSSVDLEGAYTGTNVNNYSHLISNVFVTEDGVRHFIQVAGGMVRLCTIDGTDPTRVQIENLMQLETGFDESTIISATGTVGTEGFAVVRSSDTSLQGTCLWFDTSTGDVIANGPFSSNGIAPFIASGNTVLTGETIPFSNGGCIVRAIDPREDGGVETTYAFASASSLLNAEAADPAHADEAAFTNYESDLSGGVFTVYDASGIVEAVYEQGFGSIEEVADAGYPDLLEKVTPTVVLEVDGAGMLNDVAQTPTGYCTATRTIDDAGAMTSDLTLFDADGTATASTEIPSMDSPQLSAIHIGKNGSVAVEYLPSLYAPATNTQHVIFYNTQLERLSDLLTFSRASGTWLEDGRWLSVGWKVTESTSGAGSPSDGNDDESIYQGEFVHYTVTDEIDKASGGDEEGGSGDGGDTPSVEPGDNGEGNEAEDASLPATSDETAGTVFALAGLLGASGIAVLISARRRAR